jgi:hypothetical protein
VDDGTGNDPTPSGPDPGAAASGPDDEDLGRRLEAVERLLGPVLRPTDGAVKAMGDRVRPAWRQVTDSESRVAVSIAMAAAIGMLAALPDRVVNHPRWLIPSIALVLLAIVIIVNPLRVDASARRLRPFAFALLGLVSIANAVCAVRLIVDLVQGEGIRDAQVLLLTSGAVWGTNVIVFAVWYWEFDRGGPAERARGTDPYPDFLFTQMTEPEYAHPAWAPSFVDYLYLSFTNATAFSPTDTMPLAPWAKLTMLSQASVSILLLVLVVSRAVGILG